MRNKKIILYTFAALIGFNSCELLDPTEVVNPNLTEDAILSTSSIMTPWVQGMGRQLALVTNELVVIAELGSDNYDNTNTFYNQNLDDLTIRPTDQDIQDIQFTVARLREMADYGLTVIASADETTTPEQLATLHFYKGYSYLISGEYFSFLPIVPEGEPVASDELLNNAIAEFDQVISAIPNTSEFHMAALMGKARANYKLGNKAEAVAASELLVAASPDFVFYAEFDQVETPLNTMQTALFERGSFDDLQVLPRMDFLDPKYYIRPGNVASPIAIFKAEEAHLIIAEAAVSDADLAAAKQELMELLALVDTRPVDAFNNSQQDRTQRAPGSRPNASDIVVAASQGEEFRSGLVIDRMETIDENENTVLVPTISGTSVTSEMIEATSTEDQLLELIYLMRQEIFIAEGRRLSDMGVKFVISEVEQLANANIDASHPGITPVIPPFIDAIKAELDAFTYDATAKTVVITHNVNKVLVNNKTSDLVLPFH